MASSNRPGSAKSIPKDKSGTDGDAEVLCSPQGTKNIEPSIHPRVQETAASVISPKMDWEPTAALAKPPIASISSVSKTLEDMNIENIPNIIEDYFKNKIRSDQSFSQPSCSNLLSPEKYKNVPMKPTAEATTKTSTGFNIAGPSTSKAPLQNPLVKKQADQGASKSGFKLPPLKQLDLPLTKQTLKDSSELADACRFFLNFMKSKRTDLMYKEGELDKCTTDIQKALKDSEQICFKLENEPETLPEEMSAAVTQAQKLAYLLSISYRSFKKLDDLGTKLQGQLQSYTKESEMFHESADRLLQYIVETIFEKCKQSL